MSSDSAAVFAQVIPALMIAAFLGNFSFHKAPAFIKQLMLYVFLLAGAAEFALLLRLAGYWTNVEYTDALALFACGAMLLLMAVMLAVRMGSKPEPQ